jgi:hypothetical protein
MNTVTINGKDFMLPASWNELTRDQLIYMAGLFSKKLSVVDFKAHLLWKFLRVKTDLMGRIDEEDAHGLAQTFNFLLEDVRLTTNLIPRIGRYYGPGNAMMDCSFGEFTKASMKLEDYARTGEDKYLDELVAILYRPRKKFWFIRKWFTDTTDCRVRFIEKYLDRRSQRMVDVNHNVKYAVYLFVTGVLCSLPDKFPNVYRKKGGNEKNLGGWAALIISLADGKTDDESLDRVFYSNMYNVFMGLEQKAIEYFKFLKETQND